MNKPGDIISAEIKVEEAKYDNFYIDTPELLQFKQTNNDSRSNVGDPSSFDGEHSNLYATLIKEDNTTYFSDIFIDNSWKNGNYRYLKEAEFTVIDSSEKYDSANPDDLKVKYVSLDKKFLKVGDELTITVKIDPGDNDVKYIDAFIQGGRGGSGRHSINYTLGDDDKTFSHFTGVKVDDKELEDKVFTATEGSVNVELHPDYLATLTIGEHTLTALFDDGNDVTVNFTILAKADNEDEPANNNDNNTDNNAGNDTDSSDSQGTDNTDSNTNKADDTNINNKAATVSNTASTPGSTNTTATAAKPSRATASAARTASTATAASSSGISKTTSVGTGDKNHTFIWIIAAGSALATATAAMLLHRRKKEEK